MQELHASDVGYFSGLSKDQSGSVCSSLQPLQENLMVIQKNHHSRQKYQLRDSTWQRPLHTSVNLYILTAGIIHTSMLSEIIISSKNL